jgi:D-alanyl-D-alanine carboxypeptidase (penicillin-binding protein 5/6)
MTIIDYFSWLRRILVFSIILSLAWKLSSLLVLPISPPTQSPVNMTPAPVTNYPPPEFSAQNVLIIDRSSQTVLLAKNADDPIYPASTTKMMTAIIAFEHYPLTQLLHVSKYYPEGTNINLKPGEEITVENLLYALLVQSANDAAEVLADSYPSGKAAFVEAMNTKADFLHLYNTHFLNPTGLDQEGHYSSAADLARLADYLLQFPYLARIVATQNAVITSADYSSFHPLINVNRLLGNVSGVLGVKTGFTNKAGESLVTLVNRDGCEVIISLLGSTDRFTDTENLIEWVYSAFTWPHS